MIQFGIYGSRGLPDASRIHANAALGHGRGGVAQLAAAAEVVWVAAGMPASTLHPARSNRPHEVTGDEAR